MLLNFSTLLAIFNHNDIKYIYRNPRLFAHQMPTRSSIASSQRSRKRLIWQTVFACIAIDQSESRTQTCHVRIGYRRHNTSIFEGIFYFANALIWASCVAAKLNFITARNLAYEREIKKRMNTPARL